MATATLLKSASYFPVTDVARSVAYYVATFGFTAQYVAGSPPEFAICVRDGLAVMLRRVADGTLVRPVESQGGTWDAFFWVDNVQLLHDELDARGAVIVYGPIHQKAYGMLEFAVRDPDGHVLGFGQALSDA